LHQKLTELHEAYLEAVNHFNWNKLIYEGEINFEPVVGEIYHLYEINRRFLLSMIGPTEWHQRHIGSFRLNVGRQWEPVQLADDVDPSELFA
jgi:hypothetical protein